MLEHHRVWCSQVEQPVLNRRADLALVTKTCNKVMLVFYLGLLHMYMWIVHACLHVHPRVAGSGFHLWSAPHTAVILPVGTNLGLHLKDISASSVVFWYGSIEPSTGGVGSLQLTGGRKWRGTTGLSAYQLKTFIAIVLCTSKASGKQIIMMSSIPSIPYHGNGNCRGNRIRLWYIIILFDRWEGNKSAISSHITFLIIYRRLVC